MVTNVVWNDSYKLEELGQSMDLFQIFDTSKSGKWIFAHINIHWQWISCERKLRLANVKNENGKQKMKKIQKRIISNVNASCLQMWFKCKFITLKIVKKENVQAL